MSGAFFIDNALLSSHFEAVERLNAHFFISQRFLNSAALFVIWYHVEKSTILGD
jgi:hypothetical protein